MAKKSKSNNNDEGLIAKIYGNKTPSLEKQDYVKTEIPKKSQNLSAIEQNTNKNMVSSKYLRSFKNLFRDLTSKRLTRSESAKKKQVEFTSLENLAKAKNKKSVQKSTSMNEASIKLRPRKRKSIVGELVDDENNKSAYAYKQKKEAYGIEISNDHMGNNLPSTNFVSEAFNNIQSYSQNISKIDNLECNLAQTIKATLNDVIINQKQLLNENEEKFYMNTFLNQNSSFFPSYINKMESDFENKIQYGPTPEVTVDAFFIREKLNCPNLLIPMSSRCSKDSGIAASKSNSQEIKKHLHPIKEEIIGIEKNLYKEENNKSKPKQIKTIDIYLNRSVEYENEKNDNSYPSWYDERCPLAFTKNCISWINMIKSDELYAPRFYYFDSQKYISPSSRATLIAWLSEVCEAFKFKRLTFYLTIDYIDRYLAVITDIQCSSLQMVGVTALYIACKLEEICNPPVLSLIKLTDGAATVEEVLVKEIDILQVLEWQLNEMTPFCWLCVFLQSFTLYLLKCNLEIEGLVELNVINDSQVSFKMIKKDPYSKMMQNPTLAFRYINKLTYLLEVVVLDAESLRFPSMVLAASIFYIIFECNDEVLVHTGLELKQLSTCVDFLKMYSNVLKKDPSFNHTEIFSNTLKPISSNECISNKPIENNILFEMAKFPNTQKHRNALKIYEYIKPTLTG